MIMDIAEIKRRVDLLKMANNKKYCLIPELAKELKVSKTDLMQFILDNPKLFHTDNQWKIISEPRNGCKNRKLRKQGIFIFLNLITMAYRDIMLALIKKVILNIENGFGVTLYLK